MKKEYICFDEYGNEINEWIELPDESEYNTQHFTREIISQFFEKEKVLRTLSGKERGLFVLKYRHELWCYNPMCYDRSAFEENGKWGVKNNVFGTVEVTPEYDEVTDLSDEFPSSYSHCKVRLGDKYGLVLSNKEGGRVILPPLYDEVMKLSTYLGDNDYYMKWVVKLNGKYGLSCGEKIDLEAIYDKIMPSPDNPNYLLTLKDGKYGFLKDSKPIPAEYDEIRIPSVMGWIKARKGNVWGYFDVDYQFTEDISKAFLIHFDYWWNYEEYERAYLKKLFDDYSSFVESYLQCNAAIKRKNVEGVVEGEACFEQKEFYTEYNPATLSTKVGLQLGIVEMDLIPPRYDELACMDDYGCVFSYRLNGKYGLVLADGKGTELCPPLYDEIVKMDYPEGYVLVRIGQKWGFADYGKQDFPTHLEYDELMKKERSFSGEMLIKKGDKLGVFFEGHIVPPLYDGVFVPEIFGWVRVCKNGEWGYIDINGDYTADANEAYLSYSVS